MLLYPCSLVYPAPVVFELIAYLISNSCQSALTPTANSVGLQQCIQSTMLKLCLLFFVLYMEIYYFLHSHFLIQLDYFSKHFFEPLVTV